LNHNSSPYSPFLGSFTTENRKKNIVLNFGSIKNFKPCHEKTNGESRLNNFIGNPKASFNSLSLNVTSYILFPEIKVKMDMKKPAKYGKYVS
jgi:hypothetical protein